MNNMILKTLVLKTTVITISILFMLFLYMDFISFDSLVLSDIIKYCCILLCFFISTLIGSDYINKKDRVLLQSGLFFTTLADLCLLILDHFTLGVALFCVVQILYSLRYNTANIKTTLIRFIIALEILAVLYIIINFFIIKIDILLLVTLFYAFCISTSVVNAIKAYKNNLFPFPNKYMISLGMILFLLCDINVAIYNITQFMLFNSKLMNQVHSTSFLLIWISYIPSQVLLSLSGYNFNSLSLNNFIKK